MVTLNQANPFEAGVASIDKYIEASRKLDTSGLAWNRVRDWKLEPVVLECLLFMSDIEGYTVGYLRDLLNTSAIHDPELSRFMTLWAYEELFHQEALNRFLAEFEISVARSRISMLLKQTTRSDRLMMAGARLASRVTEDFLAVFMVWGAINELT